MAFSFTSVALTLVLVLVGVDCLEITRLTVPKFVQNGTEESVVLDCEYDYDIDRDIRLVVKWFHNDDPNPVYQWIPEFNRVQSSDKFADRINTEYELSSGNKFTKRRALNILRPTTELSGKYSCHVTSFNGFDSEEEEMVVYAHPSNVYLNYTVSEGTVQIMCIVEGVFPIPEIEMFEIPPGTAEPNPVEDVTLHHVLEDGAYDVILSTNITEEELQTDSMWFFGCTVSINGTSYRDEKKVPYIPAAKAEMVGADNDDADDDLSTVIRPIVTLIIIAVTIHLTLLC